MHFSGSSTTSCDKFNFSVDIYAPSTLLPVLSGLIVEPSSNHSYRISILVRVSDESIRPYKSTDEQPWSLCIVEQSTGKVMYEGTQNNEFVSVGTDTWKPGIYVFNATFGEASVTKKVTVNSRSARR